MDYSTFERLIYGSSSANWISRSDMMILKTDLNISIRMRTESNDSKFEESWHQDLPDPHAYWIRYDLYYGSTLIQSESLVCVDGGRAEIPLPDRSTNPISITRKQYQFGKIVDKLKSLDEYLRRIGIQVL